MVTDLEVHNSFDDIPVLSSEDERRRFLSGLNDKLYMGPLWPNSDLDVSAVRSSIIRTSTSSVILLNKELLNIAENQKFGDQ